MSEKMVMFRRLLEELNPIFSGRALYVAMTLTEWYFPADGKSRNPYLVKWCFHIFTVRCKELLNVGMTPPPMPAELVTALFQVNAAELRGEKIKHTATLGKLNNHLRDMEILVTVCTDMAAGMSKGDAYLHISFAIMVNQDVLKTGKLRSRRIEERYQAICAEFPGIEELIIEANRCDAEKWSEDRDDEIEAFNRLKGEVPTLTAMHQLRWNHSKDN